MFKGDNWDRYYDTYNSKTEKFTTPSDDSEVIRRTFATLKPVFEKEQPLSALVLGVAGSRSVADYSNVFWDGFSRDNEEDRLFFLDMRQFGEGDKMAVESAHEKSFLVQADGKRIPFQENSFNLVLTHCLFDCINDSSMENMLKEVDRVTIEGGLGIHTFVDCSKVGKLFRRNISKLRVAEFGIDFHYRTVDEVEQILNKNNFQIFDMGLMGVGLNSCANLTVGCIKVPKSRVKKFPLSPFVVGG